MAKAKSENAIARQWELLKLLPPRPPGITAAELHSRLMAAGIEVTRRTIERDLPALSRYFPVACNDKGTPYGWHWMPGASLELPGMALADALSLHLVEEQIRELMPAAMLALLEPRFEQARSKLESFASSSTARWPDKVRRVPASLPLKSPSIDVTVLAGLYEALLDELQIDIDYRRSGEKEAQTRRLSPLGIVHKGHATYLVATTFHYTDPRIYAVHRIEGLSVTDEPIQWPDGFDLDDYINGGALQFGENGEIELEASVADWTANLLQETPLNDSQTLEFNSGGGAELKARVHDTWQLRAWLLSRGDGIEVKRPDTLRAWMRQIATNMHKQYEE